ncbi:MAG: DUF222 domain-containing protein [Nitriliruptoraceae bacterium]
MTYAPCAIAPAVAGDSGREDADASGVGLVDLARQLEHTVKQLGDVVDGPIGGQGDFAALCVLLRSIDIAQAAAVRLTDRIDRSPHELLGLPLNDALAALTSQPRYANRHLRTTARRLSKLPHLAAAFGSGDVSHATVRAVLQDLAQLSSAQQEQLDASFAWTASGRSADDVLADVRTRVVEASPARANREHLNQIEQRFLALTPQIDGTLTLYGQLDPESAAAFTSALDSAANTVSLHKHDHSQHAERNTATPDGHRSRARRNLDALVTIASAFLSGDATQTGSNRPKPFCFLTVDLDTILNDSSPRAALLRNHLDQYPVALTAQAARRLASDGIWQTLITRNGQILGTSDPTRRIPTALRNVVHTRDQHCRFPGCAMPAHHCDLHHVTPIEQGGPTHPDNLIALCRRHHTAITQHKWRLTMEPDGTAIVIRGNHKVISRPPLHPARRPHPPPSPSVLPGTGRASRAELYSDAHQASAQPLAISTGANDSPDPQLRRSRSAPSEDLPF